MPERSSGPQAASDLTSRSVQEDRARRDRASQDEATNGAAQQKPPSHEQARLQSQQRRYRVLRCCLL